MQTVLYKSIEHDQVVHDEWQSAPLIDVLWLMPSFPTAVGVAGGVPPMDSINRLLSQTKDVLPTGNGVVWRRTSLTKEEYFKLAEKLLEDPRIAGADRSTDPSDFDLFEPSI